MITMELIIEVFDRLNDVSEVPMIDNYHLMGLIEKDEESKQMILNAIGSLVESQAMIIIMGMTAADPYQVAAKSFLAGVLCGRLEFTTTEGE